MSHWGNAFSMFVSCTQAFVCYQATRGPAFMNKDNAEDLLQHEKKKYLKITHTCIHLQPKCIQHFTSTCSDVT